MSLAVRYSPESGSRCHRSPLSITPARPGHQSPPSSAVSARVPQTSSSGRGARRHSWHWDWSPGSWRRHVPGEEQCTSWQHKALPTLCQHSGQSRRSKCICWCKKHQNFTVEIRTGRRKLHKLIKPASYFFSNSYSSVNHWQGRRKQRLL